MFGFIKNKIKKIYSSFTSTASSLFSRTTIDEDFLQELETLLLSSDAGAATTREIIEQLRSDIKAHKIQTGQEIKEKLHEQLSAILAAPCKTDTEPRILLLVGVNGSGKTTFAGKYAKYLSDQGKKVLLVAGDTFRAAATQQLKEWGSRIGVDVFMGKENQDPASVIFDACIRYKNEKYDHLIIDTAGRLQTKTNLMRELEKIRKIITRQLPDRDSATWLTIDSVIGQSSLNQARIFNESTDVNGLVLTKLDGTGKGGVVFSITKELNLPIIYITFGEQLDDIRQFTPCDYVAELLEP